MSEWVQPLIGPGVPGPARVKYLPRLWLRTCLRQVDRLSPERTSADERFEHALEGLTATSGLARLADGLPPYIEFERRFLAAAGPLSAERIAAFNERIDTVQLEAAEAAEIRERVGLAVANERNARLLVDLDTWSYIHALAVRNGTSEIVPAVSSTSTGPLGATHVPRMWAKALLTAAGRIPPGYNSGVGGGDEFTVARLGLDMGACIEMIARERPTYMQFEGRVRSVGRHVDPASIEHYNADAARRDKPREMAAEIRTLNGITDATLSRTVLLNDVEDWYTLHQSLTERSGELQGVR